MKNKWTYLLFLGTEMFGFFAGYQWRMRHESVPVIEVIKPMHLNPSIKVDRFGHLKAEKS